MKNLKRTAAFLTLAACMQIAPAQQPLPRQPTDGIPVTKLSPLRLAAGASAQQIEQQSSLQYTQLLQQANQQNALLPANHSQVQRLRAIAQRIIPHVARWNPEAPEWKWQVNLLNSDQVNAFCMPGGRIAFYTGILQKLNLTDDEVAMVMGHEIAHALREHAVKRAGESQVTSIIGKLASLGVSAYFGIDSRVTDAAAGTVSKLAILKFSRGEETEADLVGMDLAARAGFDPRAGITLWQKMGASNSRRPIEFISTHPSGESRIGEMNKAMPLVLPVYARTRGTTAAALPPYRTTPLPKS
jgi:predicted Zn-dependent protease